MGFAAAVKGLTAGRGPFADQRLTTVTFFSHPNFKSQTKALKGKTHFLVLDNSQLSRSSLKSLEKRRTVQKSRTPIDE
jgi:hypothetical protein